MNAASALEQQLSVAGTLAVLVGRAPGEWHRQT
jgi:hypothetical protein